MSCEYLTNSLGFRHTINLNRNEHCYALVLTILLIYGVQNLTLQNNYTSNEHICQGYLKKLNFFFQIPRIHAIQISIAHLIYFVKKIEKKHCI